MPDYGTLAGFSTYHTARGRDVSAYTDPDIEAAKLIASEWIDARYRSLFGGTKVGLRAQAREWPRTGAMDVDGYSIGSTLVPTEIENATYEATLKHLVSVALCRSIGCHRNTSVLRLMVRCRSIT